MANNHDWTACISPRSLVSVSWPPSRSWGPASRLLSAYPPESNRNRLTALHGLQEATVTRIYWQTPLSLYVCVCYANVKRVLCSLTSCSRSAASCPEPQQSSSSPLPRPLSSSSPRPPSSSWTAPWSCRRWRRRWPLWAPRAPGCCRRTPRRCCCCCWRTAEDEGGDGGDVCLIYAAFSPSFYRSVK